MTQEMVTPYITREQFDRVFDTKPIHETAFNLHHADAIESCVYSYRHSNIARCYIDVVRQLAAKQAEIDRLMFEFCPNEMTEAQIKNWASHQRSVDPEKEAAINKTLGITK